MIIHPTPVPSLAHRSIDVQVFTREETLHPETLAYLELFLPGTSIPYRAKPDPERKSALRVMAECSFTHLVLMRMKNSCSFHLGFVEANEEEQQPNSSGIPKVLANLHKHVGRELKRKLIITEMSLDSMNQWWR